MKQSHLITLSSSKFIDLKWNLVISSKITFCPTFSCQTINSSSGYYYQTEVTPKAMKMIFKIFLQGKQQFLTNFLTLSSNKTLISLKEETRLLGGGCTTSKKSLNSSHSQARTGGDLTSQGSDTLVNAKFCREPSDSLQEEAISYLEKISNGHISLNVELSEWLLHFLMRGIEGSLLEIWEKQIQESSKKKLISSLRLLNKKLNILKRDHVLHSHIVLIDLFLQSLMLTPDRKILLRELFKKEDCVLFSLNLDQSHQKQDSNYLQEPQGMEELFKEELIKLREMNSLFTIMSYKRQLSHLFFSSSSILQYADRLVFSHKSAFNSSKDILSFEARFYALFYFNRLLQCITKSQKQFPQLDLKKPNSTDNVSHLPLSHQNQEEINTPLTGRKSFNLILTQNKNSEYSSHLAHKHEEINNHINKKGFQLSSLSPINSSRFPNELTQTSDLLEVNSWEFIIAYLFSQNEGIIPIIKENFGLCQDNTTTQTASQFLIKMEFLRHIASTLLKTSFDLIRLPMIPDFLSKSRIKKLTELINFRIEQEKINSVRITLFDYQSNYQQKQNPYHSYPS